MVKKKALPRFESEEAERTFWSSHDAADYLDLARFQPALFPNVKPSARTISLRLPESLLESLKVMAHKRDVTYQSLVKILLAEAVEREHKGEAGAAAPR
jgi:predicted DNA binding CopG/RHH family protein